MARRLLFCVVLAPAVSVAPGHYARAAPAGTTNAVVLEIEGKAEVMPAGSQRWLPVLTVTNQLLELYPGDGFRTLERSRATVRLSDLSLLRLREGSEIKIPGTAARWSGIQFLRGALYFFHRDKPGEFPVRTPSWYAVVRGTEFNVTVAENGLARLDLIAGEVAMTNDVGQLTLQSGEAGQAEPGQKPAKTAKIEAINVIQWVLYYPAVLEVAELELSPEEQPALADSLAAYRNGDVLAALAQYPAGRLAASDFEKVYLAALLLAVGQVEKAESTLASLTPAERGEPRPTELALALRKLIAAVKFQSSSATLNSQRATCLLAESYYAQSRSDLDAALAAARRAVEKSPRFGFGWARVAELEFSFGRIGRARDAVDKALPLAPRNAQAVSLRGFLLAAQSHYADAEAAFNQAMALDGALANAWLGRGLCRIHRGDTRGGLADLEVAATVEPQRALLRSYLGKAFSHAANEPRANQELQLAKRLDPKDPTAWLYAALLFQRENRINEAVRDLEHSQDLNNNRQVYRSRLLLDQDRAVRGANLANIYRDAGMTDVSVREAARAVNTDYANYSAHLFLAESYDALRDPRQINLRYETPWLSEFLVGNLLAPAAAGTLSPYVTQQEYSRLFERDRLGISSSTEYWSRGNWYQSASQYGLYGHTSYSLDAAYVSENGFRPNNDLRQLTFSPTLKQELTPHDSVYLNATYYDAESGDVNQYYNQHGSFLDGGPNTLLRTKEKQEPLLLAGYHHEWAPGVHTLFLGGRLQDEYRVTNPQSEVPLLVTANNNPPTAALAVTNAQQYRSELEIYTAEVQQIWQQGNHGLTVGARFQTGEFDTRNQHTDDNFVRFPSFGGLLSFPDQPEQISPDLQRVNLYGYYRWQIVDPLLLVAGLSYDWLTYPKNFRYAPLTPGEDKQEQLSPKGGLIWTPTPTTTLRGAYSQSLSGASIDQSFQLEPSQVAGFNQAFRSLIPESVAGANAGAKLESWGISLEQRFGRGTYLGLSGEWLESHLKRTRGVYESSLDPFTTVLTSSTPERLDYTERTVVLTVNQLIGEQWSLGARYRLSLAKLKDNFEAIPALPAGATDFPLRSDRQSLLNQVNLFALYQHRSGFFGQAEALWYGQCNHGFTRAEPGDDFWQFNLFAGYRFLRRQAEVRVGVMNLTGRDYNLEPLNLVLDLPRERTFVARFRFYF